MPRSSSSPPLPPPFPVGRSSSPLRSPQRTRPVTAPKPFALQGEARHEMAISTLERSLSQQKRDEDKARTFKARPMPLAPSSPYFPW